MTSIGSEKPKERIVGTAARLFARYGINAVGVDRICLEADVSKRTLYKYFPSKEALMSAAITNLGESWFEACTNTNLTTPAERITHVFKMVEPMAKVKDFYGCVLMNSSIELRDSNELAVSAARDFKGRLYTFFHEQAVEMNARKPDQLAQQLILLYDGTSAWIVMRREFPASTLPTLSLLLSAAQNK